MRQIFSIDSLFTLATCSLTLSIAGGVAGAAAAAATPTQSVLGVTPAVIAAAPQSGAYWARVTGDDVLIRSGPSIQSAYAIGRLPKGQTVKVAAVEYGWAKVAATGPAFADIYVYIKADGSSSYDAATKMLTVTGEANLIAANMDVGYAPEKSWRNVGTARAGDKFTVIDVKKPGPDTYYAVAIPASAEVWVYNQFLATLSQAEADAVEQALRGGSTPPPVPPSGPTSTPPAGNTPPTAVPAPGAGTGTTGVGAPVPAGPGTGAVTNNPPSAAPVDPVAEAEAKRKADEAAKKAAAEQRAREAAAEAARQRQKEIQARQATYGDLESRWRRVKAESPENTKLDALNELREHYVALADDTVAPATTRQLATHRADQIALRIEVQESLLELSEREAARTRTVERVDDIALAMKQRLPYDAIGRLNASTVYDGDRLPLLYKLADPTNGHTIAYVMPGPSTKPSEALGLVVGLKGVRRYDETLRVNVIVPESIDVLEKTLSASTSAPTTATTPPTTPAATPKE